MTGPARGRTIGVAIVISSPAREILEQARAGYEPTAGQMPPHVTVLAPLDVDDETMTAVVRHLERVALATKPFSLSMRGTGTFRPVSPVVFVVVSTGVSDCADLEASVRSGDMAVEARYPYHPHVTLAHDVADSMLDRAMGELSDFSADMLVRSMGLYERRDGRWVLVREFDFSA